MIPIKFNIQSDRNVPGRNDGKAIYDGEENCLPQEIAVRLLYGTFCGIGAIEAVKSTQKRIRVVQILF